MHSDRSMDASAVDTTRNEGSKTLEKAQTPSQGEVAYTRLKRRIIHCELEPGEHMTETQLVGETGIGKTPIREALTRLIQEGLVHSIRGHGYEVTPITLGDVQDLFSFRLIVEPAAAQLAAGHVIATDLRRLDEFCATHYSVGNVESEARYLHANYVFHTTIADASGNRRLSSAIRRALDESERLFHLSNVLQNRSHEVAHEHKELVDALIAGDGEVARRMAIAHITASQRLVLDALLTSSSFLAVPIVSPKSFRS